MLQARFGPNRDGNSAGHFVYDLSLDNVSGQTCTVYGFAGMQLVADNGQPLPTNLQRTPDGGFVPPAAPTLVTLPPGDRVLAQVSYSDVPDGSEPESGPCEPTLDHVLVTPPDERDQLTVFWPLAMGPVCQHGAMTINAFQEGGSADQ